MYCRNWYHHLDNLRELYRFIGKSNENVRSNSLNECSSQMYRSLLDFHLTWQITCYSPFITVCRYVSLLWKTLWLNLYINNGLFKWKLVTKCVPMRKLRLISWQLIENINWNLTEYPDNFSLCKTVSRGWLKMHFLVWNDWNYSTEDGWVGIGSFQQKLKNIFHL